jgi:hypothetical protein
MAYFVAPLSPLPSREISPTIYFGATPGVHPAKARRIPTNVAKLPELRLGSLYRSGRPPLWLKVKNYAPAVKRAAGEDWGSPLAP